MTVNSKWLSSVVLAVGVCFTSSGNANEQVGPRLITHIGCHHSDGTCFVSLDGPAFGAQQNCLQGATTQFRFDNAETPHGRRTYASLMGAYLARKQVSVAISGCSSQGVPSLSWFVISG